ncbi:MAG TPA: serine/threonine-protein kinase, partial [Chloroflexota bacterium]|nr:serine/threonine-protein kinase [Chloroflexota bacterium]
MPALSGGASLARAALQLVAPSGPPISREGKLPATGQRLGDYVIRGTLGRGASAVVYWAQGASPGPPVALKVLLPHLAADAACRETFVEDARRTSEQHHPNLMASSADQEWQGLVYVVMPLAEGGSLRQRLMAGAAPPGNVEVVRIVEGVARALDFLHGRGRLHLDVKPSNILLTASGWPLLSDLSTVDAHSGAPPLRGTPAYLAPECLPRPPSPSTPRGDTVRTAAATSPGDPVSTNECGPRSDQYALAATAYELLTGRKALPVNTVQERRQIATALPRAGGGLIPEAVERVLLRGLAIDPMDRFPTCGALAAALGAAVEATQPLGPSGRRRLAASLPLMVVLASVALVSPFATLGHWPRTGFLVGTILALMAVAGVLAAACPRALLPAQAQLAKVRFDGRFEWLVGSTLALQLLAVALGRLRLPPSPAWQQAALARAEWVVLATLATTS